MPQPKTRALPDDKGIQEIQMPAPEDEGPKNQNRMTVYLLNPDKEKLDELCVELRAKVRRPVSRSEVIRWALWHCDFDEFEKI